jgi:hypothetical protein
MDHIGNVINRIIRLTLLLDHIGRLIGRLESLLVVEKRSFGGIFVVQFSIFGRAWSHLIIFIIIYE